MMKPYKTTPQFEEGQARAGQDPAGETVNRKPKSETDYSDVDDLGNESRYVERANDYSCTDYDRSDGIDTFGFF